MGAIIDEFEEAFRDFVTDGVASSGLHEPTKSELRALGQLIEAAIANVGLGALVDVVYATKAEMDADLAHDADSVGLVYGDPTDGNNDLYVKTGASGAGAWTLTSAFHDIVENLTQPYVDAVTAEVAALVGRVRNTAQARINQWKVEAARGALLCADAQYQVAQAKLAGDRILARIRAQVSSRTIIYADPSKTGGLNNGTSWANAYTDLATAIAATTTGCLLITNSTEASPFPAPAAAIVAAASYVEWRTDLGDAGETWISGALKASDWESMGGNIYRRPMAAAPQRVAYNLRRDDLAGTITGGNLNETRIAATLGVMFSGDSVWSPSDAVLWLGGLAEETVATATPAADKWSHTGGYLYVNSSEAASLADINANLSWTDGRDCLHITAAITDWNVSGKLTCFFTICKPGQDGYSIRLSNAKRIHIANARSILSGDHAFGTDNLSGDRVSYDDIVAVQHTTAASPIVHKPGATYTNVRHRTGRVTIIGAGLLSPTGAQLTANHVTGAPYAHTAGGGVTIDGIRHGMLAIIDMSGQIAAKSGVANSATVGATTLMANTALVRDESNPNTFGCQVSGLVYLGRQAWPFSGIAIRGFYVDGMGYGSVAVDQFSAGTATLDYKWYLRDGFWFPPLARNVITAAAANDKLNLINVVGLAPAEGFVRSTVVENTITMQNCMIDGTIIQLGATPWASATLNLVSKGGNIFSGSSPVRHTNPANTPKTQDQLLAAIDPNGRDAKTDSLDWAL